MGARRGLSAWRVGSNIEGSGTWEGSWWRPQVFRMTVVPLGMCMPSMVSAVWRLACVARVWG